MPDISGWFEGLSLWSIVAAVASVVVGWILARMTRRWVSTLLQRLRGLSRATIRLGARAAYVIVLLVAVSFAFSFLGAPSAEPLIFIAIVLAAVAAFALRGIGDNFASGIVLQTRRTIDLGEVISSQDHVGTVIDMNSRAVVLRTVDGLTVHLPNSSVLQNALTNYTEATTNRSEIEIRLDCAGDRARTRTEIKETVAGVPGVVTDPPVEILTVLDAPDRLTLRVRFWSRPLEAQRVASDVVDRLAASLRESGREAAVTSSLPPPPAPPALRL